MFSETPITFQDRLRTLNRTVVDHRAMSSATARTPRVAAAATAATAAAPESTTRDVDGEQIDMDMVGLTRRALPLVLNELHEAYLRGRRR